MRGLSKLILVSSCLSLLGACSHSAGSNPSSPSAPNALEASKQRPLKPLVGTLELKRQPKRYFGAYTDVELQMQSPLDRRKEIFLFRNQFGGVPSTEFSLYHKQSTETSAIESSMQCAEGRGDVCDLAVVAMKLKPSDPKQEAIEYVLYFQRELKESASDQKPLMLKFKYRVSVLNPGGVKAGVLNIAQLRDLKRLD